MKNSILDGNKIKTLDHLFCHAALKIMDNISQFRREITSE